MKKLVVAAAAIIAAVAVQAATCTWGSGALRTAASAEGGWGSTTVNAAGALVTMNVYLIDAATYTSLSSSSQEDLWNAYSIQAADLSGVNKSSTDALIGAITINETDAYAGVQYAVVTASYHDATYNKDMYMAALKQTTYNSATSKGTGTGVFSAVNNWQAVGEAVPEPTSGLLLLLGMAGLALKRKQA